MYLSGTKDIEIQTAMSQVRDGGRDLYPSAMSLDACRALDLLIALGVLIFMAPLMIAIAVAIKVQDGGPVLFGHGRLGRGGRTFRCWKFRSMEIDAEARLAALLARDPVARREWEADHKLRRDPRVTPLGAFLRVTSLDEFPQLFNVLSGEMSLVGPRPIVTAEVGRYGRWFSRYCEVRPGITGLWQVSGRNDVDYRRRVAMDVLYTKTRSPHLYLKVLLATVPAVVSRNGSY
ncbi:sugar transferase [Phenylobacterium hankyongense]|nr:sugar transferase [Phenylobacterium hankyongense]